ncbi:MAG: N-6 DNA methylase [Chitinophagaceae bacterium]|nr:N-6 DNA methylase [Chitinophagaceae bacterium]
MNKDELRELLHQEYQTENWKKITEFVFPNVQYLQRPQSIPFSNDKVESFKQIGNVKLTDGKNLAMFEVKVAKNVNLASNKVELRKLVAPLIDQERNHGVLVIYEQGKEDYRFTFTAKSTEFDEEVGDFVNKETDAKRFTYILGKNESCKTAAERFFQLATNKTHADINAVQDAFSVEKLSKQFFKEYKEHYEKFVAYLMSKPGYLKTIFKADDKAVRDFVKLLLGRMVFIQFVQKKRWMGVPATSAGWHEGESNFLVKAFSSFQKKELFYSSFLEPLFYETLNKPNRPNDVFKVTGTKIPFLNGGLFEKGGLDTSLINFPASYFNDVLEFFDRYNFTINEYDTNEHEVGIDPEMLGSIFENLLEDNKDKGAFYTPKEIVHYMCQESLKEYLKTFLQEKNVWPENKDAAINMEASLESFVKKKEAGGVIDFDELLATALRDVKICDPSIGSGAFPMGLLNEIYHCVYVLYKVSPDVVGEVWKMDNWAPDIVKKNIIQNSIYGVDVEKGAVDIARLRFWLSLIIDEPEPHALPNLDYKIVVGNSLVSKLGDDIIDINWDIKQSVGKAEEYLKKLRASLSKLSNKQKLYFDSENKVGLKEEIRKLKIDILIHQLSFNKEQYANKNVVKNDMGFGLKPVEVKNNLEVNHTIKGYNNAIKNLEILKSHEEEPLNFFDWKLDFPEVMNEQVAEKVGFDLIIMNPPYIGEKGNKEKFQDVCHTPLSEFYLKKMDYFYFFYHQALNIAKSNGFIAGITTNYYVTATGGTKLRKDIKERSNVKKLVNFGEAKVFPSALGQHNLITFLSKKKKNDDTKVISVNRNGILESKIFDSIFSGIDKETNYQIILEGKLFDGEEQYIRIVTSGNNKADNLIDSILNKIKQKGSQLGDICEVNQGLRTGADKVSPKHIGEYGQKNNYDKGDGIFILHKNEVRNLNL